ncbi:MAG: hypothetical protein K8S23_01100 [Candidatus Cloacimonetes bacterium]|nr:hypothetical protein [Candidatus Cloacimonadota bacterium]
MKIILSRYCPVCKSKERKRMLGFGVFQNLPFSNKYECEECASDYLVFLGLLNILLVEGQAQKAKISRRKRIFIALLNWFVMFFIIGIIAVGSYLIYPKINNFIERKNVLGILGIKQKHSVYNDLKKKDVNKKKEETKEEKAFRKKLDSLFEKAQSQIDKRKLIEPKGDNAWETYNEILLLDKFWNYKAGDGLKQVKEELVRFQRREAINEKTVQERAQLEEEIKVKLEFAKLQVKLEKEESDKKLLKQQKREQDKIKEKLEKQKKEKLEREYQKKVNDFWFSIDLSWQQILAQTLNKNKITQADISDLAKIKKINCSKTRIKHLEPLRFLTELEELDCSETEISSLEPIATLVKIKKLNCSNTQIGSLERISNFADLVELDFSFTNVESMAPIKNMKYLKILKLAKTKLVNLKRLQNFNQLEELDISDTKIKTLNEINSSILRKINIAGTLVTTLNSLEKQLNLTYLNCANTTISNFTTVEKLEKLKYFDCSSTEVKNLRFLSKSSELRILKISDTSIDKITFLEDLINLEKLYCNCYYLPSVDEFGKLTKLKSILVNYNTLTKKFEEKHPKCKIIKTH